MLPEPHLFFSPPELEDLVRRREADPVGRQLFYNQMAAADWCRRQPVMAGPDPGPAAHFKDRPLHPGESGYTDDYLLAHEAFEIATSAYERAVAQMALAYRLTGDRLWADRALAWIDAAMNEWPRWGPLAGDLDQFAVRVMQGTAIGCDWLADAMPESLRHRCVERVGEFAARCLDAWGPALDGSSGELHNHLWFNMGMVGLTALWLADADAAWRDVADRCGRGLARLCDWAIGPDGDYLDKPLFLMYAFRWALPTMFAWRRAGGGDVLAHPHIAASADWLCDMCHPGDWDLVDMRQPLLDGWILSLLAAEHRHGRAQWIALQQVDMPPIPCGATWMAWMCSGATFSYLFHDETVPAVAPDQVKLPPARWYRSSGWAVLSRDATADTPTVHLFAGPTSGKSFYNQGEVIVSAFGERLLEPPRLMESSYIEAHKSIAYTMSDLAGLVLLADGLGQASGHYPDEWPGNAALGREPLPPMARITAVEAGDDWCSATADLTGAYRDFSFDMGMWGFKVTPLPEGEDKSPDRLERFVRHVRLVGGEWLLITDDVAPHPGRPVDLEWRFTTNGAITFPSPDQATLEIGRAAMDLHILEPAGLSFAVMPAHTAERSEFLCIKAGAPDGPIRLVVVARIRRRSAAPMTPEWRDGRLHLPGRPPISLPDPLS
jgi:hypothetical protein